MLSKKIIITTIAILCFSAIADTVIKWDKKNIGKRELCRLSTASSERDGSIVFEFNTRAPWPSFDLKPAGATTWDLSKSRYIAFDAENLNEQAQCEFSVKVNGKIIGNGVLEPKAKEGFMFKLNHRGNQSFDPLFLGKGMPDGFNGGYNIDTSKVKTISFASYYPTYAKYRISQLRVCGDYKQTKSTTSAKTFFPLIDAYGQYIHAEWTEKIKKDENLRTKLIEEKAQLKEPVKNWNKWGGWENGPTLKATGFFHVKKYQKKWWLVDPDGKLFFSRGINAINEDDFISGNKRSKIFATKSKRHDGGYMFYKDNLKRKYGKDYQKEYYPFIHRRLDSWGFNTVGNWSSHGISQLLKHPYVLCLRMYEVKNWTRLKNNKFYDVFIPEFKNKMNHLIDKTAWCINDPWCVGIFIGNELNFGNSLHLALATIASPKSQAAKQEFCKLLKKKYNDIGALNKVWNSAYLSWQEWLDSTKHPDVKKAKKDLEAFSTKFVERFFEISRNAIKNKSPKTMYLGSRLFCGDDYFRPYLNKAAAKYCDVVSYNLYQLSFDRLKPWKMPDVPILITECTVGDSSRGRFVAHTNPGLIPGARARALNSQLKSAARHPQIVGIHHFAFKDQVLTGRWGRGGENYGFGLVDIADTPYKEYADANRKFSEQLYEYRLKSEPVKY